MPHHARAVDESALGPAHLDGLADDKRGHVLGDVALRVRLDQEVEVAGLVVAGDGRVGAHNLLCRAVGLGDGRADGDVLADGEAEDVVALGQLEAVTIDKEVQGQSLLPSFLSRIRSPSRRGRGSGREAETYMATLWEMTVFSCSSYSLNTSGLRTGLSSVAKIYK